MFQTTNRINMFDVSSCIVFVEEKGAPKEELLKSTSLWASRVQSSSNHELEYTVRYTPLKLTRPDM